MEARRSLSLLPLAVFLIALLIRLPGLGWGLRNDLRNASLHPDEALNFAYSRNVNPVLGQLTPGFYNYGTLYLSTLHVASDVASGYTGGPKTKAGWSWTDSSQTDWDWVSRCTLAGRIVSVLAGAATSLIAFLLARRVAGPIAGVLAGAFVAIAPAHVVHSRFQTPDVLAAALIGAALLFAVFALEPKGVKARFSPVTWCALFTGLSAGVKYTGILVLLALWATLALRKQSGWIRDAVLATAGSLAVFVCTTPGILLDTSKFVQDFTYEMRHTASGQELFFAGTSSGLIYHLGNLSVGIGLVLLLLSVAGLGWAAFRRQPWAIVLLTFLVPYYLLIGRAEVKYMRYTFPLYVGLAAGFGYAVVAAQKRKLWDKAAIAAAIVGYGGVPGGGLRDTVPLTLAMSSEDPRDAAGRWLQAQGGSVGLARDPWYWSATLIPDGANPRNYWPAIRQEILTSNSPKVEYVLAPDGSQTYFDQTLFDRKPERIATTNFEVDYPAELRARKDLSEDETIRVATANAWIDRLKQDYDVERIFANRAWTYHIEDMDYVQPIVTLWKRKTP